MQRIKYKNKQVSTYKIYYITQMIWQGTKVGTWCPYFQNGPLWVWKKIYMTSYAIYFSVSVALNMSQNLNHR